MKPFFPEEGADRDRRRPHGAVQPARPERQVPDCADRPARHGRVADVARRGAPRIRRSTRQPVGTGPFSVRQPQRGLRHPIRPQRRAGGTATSTSTPSSSSRSPTRTTASTCCSAASSTRSSTDQPGIDPRPARRRRRSRTSIERRRRGVVRDDQLGGAAVRRHPRPAGAHTGDTGRALHRSDRARRRTGRPTRCSSRRARSTTPTSSRRATTRTPRAALAAEYCAERGTEENPVLGTPTCTDGKINIELQWSGPSVVQTRIADLLDEGWSVAFNVTFDELPQDEHIQQTALGQYNVVTWRQFGADGPDPRQRLAAVPHDRRHLAQLATVLRRGARRAAARGAGDGRRRPSVSRSTRSSAQKINDDYLYIFFNHTLWDNAFAENVRGVCDRTAPDGDAADRAPPTAGPGSARSGLE